MQIEYDPVKDAKNRAERGLAFERARDFDFATARYIPDERMEYGETRIIAYGEIDGRLHVLCFKPIASKHIRVISLRKANKREERRYG